jgi:hypothetical protein
MSAWQRRRGQSEREAEKRGRERERATEELSKGERRAKDWAKELTEEEAGTAVSLAALTCCSWQALRYSRYSAPAALRALAWALSFTEEPSLYLPKT